MNRSIQLLLPALAGLLLLASCQSVPEHVHYIPKDAMMVLGVHTGEMRKDLAWSAITGSNLLEELRRASRDSRAPEMLKDAENAGIDYGSTLYLYTKRDARFGQGSKLVAVLPVSDEEKVTAYIRKHAPEAAIRKVNGRSEAMIGDKVYVGWNEEVLIAMNPLVQHVAGQMPAGSDSVAEPLSMPMPAEELADAAGTAREMEAAFNPAKDAAISGNSRFKELERAGHDITMWVAYDDLMDEYGSRSGMGGLGRSLGPMLWKGSALATGFDFEKGRIDGAMRYYTSDSMRAVAREFGKNDVDGDMLRRLPATGLNFAAGYHLSPTALRMMMDKLGVTGMANLALGQNGMSVDDILGAFAGDMVVSLNNFRVETTMEEIDSATQADFGLKPYPVNSPKLDYVFAMKIGDKAKMSRLIGFATTSRMLQQAGPNMYVIPNTSDGPTLVMNDKYVAVSSTGPGAQAFLQAGTAKMPEAVDKEIAGHPTGMWADVRSFMAGAGALAAGGETDSAAFKAMQNMFTTFTGHGGEFKDNATEYHMSLGFTNKEESSLVQLLHLAQKLSAANNKAVARR